MDYNNNPFGSDHNSGGQTGWNREDGMDKKETDSGIASQEQTGGLGQNSGAMNSGSFGGFDQNACSQVTEDQTGGAGQIPYSQGAAQQGAYAQLGGADRNMYAQPGGAGQNVYGQSGSRAAGGNQNVYVQPGGSQNGYGQNTGRQNGYGQTAYGGNPYEQNAYHNSYQDPYSQYGYRNPYQPAAQTVYQPELEEPVSMADWLGTVLLAFIPCAGVIVYLIWAFGSDTKKSKANFCKAVLIIHLAVIALSFILGVFRYTYYW